MPRRSIVQGAFEHLPEGSSWWIHALLETEAGTAVGTTNFLGRNDVDRADYSHTLEAFLEPGEQTPDARFTYASGATCRPVAPESVEAPNVAMLALAILALLRLRAPAHEVARAAG